jgi:phosphatidylserine decarboxylase
MKLAPEGYPQMLACTAAAALGAAAALIWFWPLLIPLALVWGWSIAFFRDPKRVTVATPTELCSPADGTVQDITEFDHYGPIEGPAVRIGIFLSLFNVHINRAPCAGTVRSATHVPGKFLAAMKPEAIDVNESNTLVLDPPPEMPGPIVVRQIVGMAARRIVCHAVPGTKLLSGERFGLIKFGSRTELIIPRSDRTKLLVELGQKVQAGVTILARQGVAPGTGSPESTEQRTAAVTS